MSRPAPTGIALARLVAVAVLAGVACGCIVRGPRVAVPSQGGPGWMELRSSHFALTTDTDPENAEQLVGRLEETYNLLARTIFGASSAPNFVTRLICFRSETEYREFVPAPFAGQYTKRSVNDIEALPTMTMFGNLSPWNQVTLAHELVHRFNQVALGSMPAWLNEGLAQYYSTIRGERNSIVPIVPIVGELDPENGLASGSVWSRPGAVIFKGEPLDVDRLPKASVLINLTHARFYGASRLGVEASWESRENLERNYATAWALVHLLMSGQSSFSARFQAMLRSVPPGENVDDRLDTVLPDADLGTLDRELDEYLRKPLPWRQHHPKAAPTPEGLARRSLSDGQVLALWATLDAFDGPQADRAKHRLDQALQASPDDPEVNLLCGRYFMVRSESPRQAERHFQAARASRPDDPRADLGLALLYMRNVRHTWPEDQRSRLLAETVSRLTGVARTANELDFLAVYHLGEGRAREALPFEQRASALEPACWRCVHNQALASARLGDVAAAVTLERAAIERLPEDASDAILEELQEALASYQRAAADPAATARIKLFLPE